MKKYLLAITCIISSSLWAQFLKVHQQNYYYGEAGQECVAKLSVENLTEDDLNIIVIRNDGLVAEENYMCWKVCHTPDTDLTYPHITIPAGATVDNFSGHILSMPEEVDITINYCFADADKISRQECVDVRYTSSSRFMATEEQDLERLSVYPNPVRDHLTIEYEGLQPKEFMLYDLLGNEVCRHALTSSRRRLNLSSLNPGIYFYALRSKGKIGEIKKLIVTK